MRSHRFAIILLLAAILVVEPVVHTHPIAGNGGDPGGLASSSICAFCAAAAPHVTVVRPLSAAPVVVVESLVVVSPHRYSFDTPLPLASRAPPAA